MFFTSHIVKVKHAVEMKPQTALMIFTSHIVKVKQENFGFYMGWITTLHPT